MKLAPWIAVLLVTLGLSLRGGPLILAGGVSTAGPENPPNPTAYWGFDSNAVDYASTNHFVTNGTAAFVGGVRGSSLALSPDAAWLSIADNVALSSASNSFEITGWLLIDPGNLGGDYLLGKGFASPDFEWYWRVRTNHLAGYAHNGGFGVFTFPAVPLTNQWTWFSLSWDSNTANLSAILGHPANAASSGALSFPMQDGTNALVIGRNPVTGTVATFRIDELAWFQNTNLTHAQRLAIFNSGYGRTYTNGIGWR